MYPDRLDVVDELGVVAEILRDLQGRAEVEGDCETARLAESAIQAAAGLIDGLTYLREPGRPATRRGELRDSGPRPRGRR